MVFRLDARRRSSLRMTKIAADDRIEIQTRNPARDQRETLDHYAISFRLPGHLSSAVFEVRCIRAGCTSGCSPCACSSWSDLVRRKRRRRSRWWDLSWTQRSLHYRSWPSMVTKIYSSQAGHSVARVCLEIGCREKKVNNIWRDTVPAAKSTSRIDQDQR